MRDPITEAALDPSCILCLTPDRGGSWWSRLRPGTVWPSSTPRNFAAEPEKWYNFGIAQEAADWTHDYTFQCRFKLTQADAVKYIFYSAPTACMFSIMQLADGRISCFSNMLESAMEPIGRVNIAVSKDIAAKFFETTHTLRLAVLGNSFSVYVDDELIASFNLYSHRTTKAGIAFDAPVTQSGQVHECWLRDDTIGRIVWSYPSEAERVRLITLTNISTQNGFNVADPAQPARVDTALDLRGKVSSYTLIVDCELTETVPNVIKHEIAGQGPAVAYDEFPAICSLSGGSTGNIQLSQEIAGERVILYKKPELTGRHYIAGVVEVGTATTRLALYLDGKLFIEQTFDGIPTGVAQSGATNFALFDNRNGAYTQKYAPIYSCLLFGRALTAAEIAALSQGGS